MSTPTVAPAELGLASLDERPACQCPHGGHGCEQAATVRAQIAHTAAHQCRPFTRLLCDPCLRTLVVGMLTLMHDYDAPFVCEACDETITTIHDLLPSIRSL